MCANLSPEIIGYTNRFSVAPGDDLEFMISANVPQAQAQLVRLVHGDARSPIGFVEREVDSALDTTLELSEQEALPGSFGRIEPRDGGWVGCVSGHLYAQPTMLGRDEPQGLLAQLDQSGDACWELVVEPTGDLVLRGFAPSGASQEVRLGAVLSEGVWHSIAFSIGCDSGTLRLWVTAPGGDVEGGGPIEAELKLEDGDLREAGGPLLLAARRELTTPDGCEPRAAHVFDGRLERPQLFSRELDRDRALALLAGREAPAPPILDLDLGAAASGWQIRDRVAGKPVGRLYNAPLRATPSHRFDGTVFDPRLEPDHFAAVGFHHDDVHHANWVPTRSWQVPADLPSGIYALRLRGGGAEDRIPFIVRPPRERATSSVALWIPDFTYAAYANEQDCAGGTSYGDFHPESDPLDHLMWRHPEWGASTYDLHADGSGVAISSLARPVPNLRPDYRQALVNGPRHLAGDLYIVQWLEQIGIEHDVITDSDVHAEGAELLSRYDTVLTAGHPEYVTGELIDALETYTDGGGRLMYLGANGFYWVTTVAPDEESTTVEVRRGVAGTRQWTPPPGEYHHQFTGEPGGIWRFRGRGPHRTLGIGFVSEGWDGHNRPYRRQDGSFDSRAAWAFAGIGENEPIGEHGLVMDGAAGDEIDSANRALGTPAETIVLASSSGHSDAYWLVVEDVLWNHGGNSGTASPLIHADIALTPKPNSGAIFAVGSISYTACLSHDDYRNPLARLTENVLRAFMDRDAAPWEGETGGSSPG